jgi:hypothetical protein
VTTEADRRTRRPKASVFLLAVLPEPVSMLCEHGKVRTTCRVCKAGAPVSEPSRILTRMMELAGKRDTWTTQEGVAFAARVLGDGIEFTPHSGRHWHQSLDNVLTVVRAFLDLEKRGRVAKPSDVQGITRSGSYILAIYRAARLSLTESEEV